MFRRDRCYNGGSRHSFKPRYEEIPSRGVDFETSWHFDAAEFRKMVYSKVYIHDICTWCGKKVKKDE